MHLKQPVIPSALGVLNIEVVEHHWEKEVGVAELRGRVIGLFQNRQFRTEIRQKIVMFQLKSLIPAWQRSCRCRCRAGPVCPC